MTSNWEERITVDPDVMGAKPVVKRTRLPVEFVLGLVAQGWSDAELIKNYPRLTLADIQACLAYAGVREYTDEETAEFIEADRLDEETRAIAERFLGGSWA
jgi:uncharacterized protein (DUF433 family)